MEQSQQYRKTGNTHHIPLPDMIEHVVMKINQFNEIKEATGGVPPQNPFSDPIVFTTKDGRTVQIPEQVQQQAVQEYHKMIIGDHDEVDEIEEEYIEEPKLVVVEQDNTYMWMAIIILSLILLYFIYLQSKKIN